VRPLRKGSRLAFWAATALAAAGAVGFLITLLAALSALSRGDTEAFATDLALMAGFAFLIWRFWRRRRDASGPSRR
jgi:hypothetical protein